MGLNYSEKIRSGDITRLWCHQQNCDPGSVTKKQQLIHINYSKHHEELVKMIPTVAETQELCWWIYDLRMFQNYLNTSLTFISTLPTLQHCCHDDGF